MFSAFGNMDLYCLEGDLSTAYGESFYLLYIYLYLWNTKHMIFWKNTWTYQNQNKKPKQTNKGTYSSKSEWRISTPPLYRAKEASKFLNKIWFSLQVLKEPFLLKAQFSMSSNLLAGFVHIVCAILCCVSQGKVTKAKQCDSLTTRDFSSKHQTPNFTGFLRVIAFYSREQYFQTCFYKGRLVLNGLGRRYGWLSLVLVLQCSTYL